MHGKYWLNSGGRTKKLIEDSLVSSIESNPKLSSSQSESTDRHPGYKLKARYAAKWCYVSTSSSISVRVAELLVFEGTVNKSWCPRGMLVDGGASCSFIDESFARTLNCDQCQLPKPLVIKTANGGKVKCSHVIAAAEIGIEGHVGCHDLIVIPHLDEFDVVLGRTFLESSKAVSTPHHHRSCQSVCRHHHLRFRSQQQRLKHSSVFVSGSPSMSIE